MVGVDWGQAANSRGDKGHLRMRQSFVVWCSACVVACLNGYPSSVFTFEYPTTQYLFRSKGSTLPFDKLGMEQTTCVAKCTDTIGPSPPFRSLCSSASMTFVSRLIYDLWGHMVRSRTSYCTSGLPRCRWMHRWDRVLVVVHPLL